MKTVIVGVARIACLFFNGNFRLLRGKVTAEFKLKSSCPSESGLLSGSLNINKADTELQKKRSKIVARNVEKSLMILFLKDYGWLQLAVQYTILT